MSLRFARPELLWLLLPLLPLAGLALGRRAERSRRRWLAAGLRASIFMALVLGLAQPQWERAAGQRSAALLLDVSDSLPDEQQQRGEAFALALADQSAEERQLGLLRFGERALVERAPRDGPLERLYTEPGGGRSDLNAALRLGAAILPPDGSRRIVLASDGRHNVGALSLEEALALPLAQGIPVDLLPLPAAVAADEQLLASLEAPGQAREGQAIDLEVVIRSQSASEASLQLYAEDALVEERQLTLLPGERRERFQLRADSAGPLRYEAVLLPERDGRLENNRAAAVTLVAGAPKVLVLADSNPETETALRPLLQVLEQGGRQPELRPPERAPTSLLDAAAYASVILVDVPARRLPQPSMAILRQALRELGVGLIMIGGPRSFGAGGYRHTPVEAALPVEMEVRDKEKRPEIDVAFVIDRSGSMGHVGASGMSKLDLAREAVLQAAELLSPRDRVAVIAFDEAATSVWPLEAIGPESGFEPALFGLQPGGGTNLLAGLSAAVETLSRSEAPLRHILLLSDGQSATEGLSRLAARANAEGITLSIVATGQDAAPHLPGLADTGGGRFHSVAEAAEIPQIFVEETLTTLGAYVVEERFQPRLGMPSPILGEIDAAPALDGYNATSPRQSAVVALWSERDDPLLAHWQHGLGRSVAWTPDLSGRWAASWLAWPGFGDFVLRMVDWSLAPAESGDLRAQARLEAARLSLSLDAAPGSPARAEDASAQAVLVGPDDSRIALTLTRRGPGRFSADLDLPLQGAWLARISARAADDSPAGSTTAAFVLPYSPEYADPAEAPLDPRLFALAEASGGRVIEHPEEAFRPVPGARSSSPIWPLFLSLAALLFPLDVASRRLRLRLGALGRLRGAWLRSRAAAGKALPGGESQLGGLRAARDQARRRRSSDRPAAPGERASEPEQPRRSTGAEPPMRDVGAASSGDAASDRLATLREAKRRAARRRGE